MSCEGEDYKKNSLCLYLLNEISLEMSYKLHLLQFWANMISNKEKQTIIKSNMELIYSFNSTSLFERTKKWVLLNSSIVIYIIISRVQETKDEEDTELVTLIYERKNRKEETLQGALNSS